MPQLDSTVIALLASVLSALTQLVKGVLLGEDAKRYLPLGILFFGSLAGILMAFYYGRDPVVGLIEGAISGLTALGLYASAKSVAPAAVNTDGWIKKKDSA
jgi:hypothetical protein